ncbi:MAG TPA: AAA family ATPase [Pseudobacteroides sp.]|uniref:AAA family ATPase n=1 Tax=Pseudobacteroides sp. TaxID=1968840 RepID=UPI002F93C6FE
MNLNLYIERVLFNSDFNDTSYIRDIPVIRKLIDKKELNFNKPVTFIVGENGTGKSTLLEAIAIRAGFNAEGGSRNFNFSTKATESTLHQYVKVSRKRRESDGFFLRAESFYNVATQVDDLNLNLDGYGGRSLHHQSHGESFMALVQNRFRGNGLYILDEPEAALSPLRQMTLLAEFNRLVKNNSQFIIATHSPILLAYPNSDIFELTDDDIKITEYKKTEHYTLTKRFLDNPEKMLKYLFDE